MLKSFFPILQYLMPQHALTKLAGQFADSNTPWLKDLLIKRFISHYQVDLSEAAQEDPQAYESFNAFFIRHLKPNARSVDPSPQIIVSPADGKISEIGQIKQNQLLQTKQMYFDLENLLGGDKELTDMFIDGSFVTTYLAPKDYHRVHMPCSGQLLKTIYVPGKLFSVNQMTADLIPNLYGRNERFISVFNTAAGPMAVIMVGAMIVGSIQTAWMDKPVRSDAIRSESLNNGYNLNKGGELGYFKLGSTVILLFGKNRVEWLPAIKTGTVLQYGQSIANII